jgi:hypothetical protein
MYSHTAVAPPRGNLSDVIRRSHLYDIHNDKTHAAKTSPAARPLADFGLRAEPVSVSLCESKISATILCLVVSAQRIPFWLVQHPLESSFRFHAACRQRLRHLARVTFDPQIAAQRLFPRSSPDCARGVDGGRLGTSPALSAAPVAHRTAGVCLHRGGGLLPLHRDRSIIRSPTNHRAAMRVQTQHGALFCEIRAVRHFARRDWLELLSALVMMVSLIAASAVVFLAV